MVRQRSNHSLAVVTLLLLAGCVEPTVPDRDEPYEFRLAGEVFHWPRARLPVRYWVEPAGQLRQYVAMGLERWEAQFLYGEFHGIFTDDSVTADVVIRLEGGAPPVASPTGTLPPVGACAPASTFVPNWTADGRITGPLRVTLRWRPGVEPAVVADCLVLLAAHELGHTLGVFAESDGDSDLMNTNPRTFTPSPRDRATVQVLYQTTPTLVPATPTP